MTELKKRLKLYLEKATQSLKNRTTVALSVSLLLHGAVAIYLYKLPTECKRRPIEIKISQYNPIVNPHSSTPPKITAKLMKQVKNSNKFSQKKVVHDLSRIIPKELRAMVAKLSPKGKGYYGIGYYPGDTKQAYFNGEIIYGVAIGIVVEGYPADLNGFKEGDILIMCDGHWGVEANNWVRGVSPTPITIIVYRNGQIIEKSFKREWISEEP